MSGIEADGLSASEVTLHHTRGQKAASCRWLPSRPAWVCLHCRTDGGAGTINGRSPRDTSKCLSSCANLTADSNAEHCVKPGYTGAGYIKSMRQNLAVLGCATAKNMFYLRNPIKLGAKFVLHDELI